MQLSLCSQRQRKVIQIVDDQNMFIYHQLDIMSKKSGQGTVTQACLQSVLDNNDGCRSRPAVVVALGAHDGVLAALDRLTEHQTTGTLAFVGNMTHTLDVLAAVIGISVHTVRPPRAEAYCLRKNKPTDWNVIFTLSLDSRKKTVCILDKKNDSSYEQRFTLCVCVHRQTFGRKFICLQFQQGTNQFAGFKDILEATVCNISA